MKNIFKIVLNFVLIFIINFIFLDFVHAIQYNNFDESEFVSCGEKLIDNIPAVLPNVVSKIYLIVQVAVPIVLVIIGSIGLIKCIVASKEDEIKKEQQILIKRVVSAVIIFFIFTVVKFLISLVADNNNILECAECFIENNDKCVVQKNN